MSELRRQRLLPFGAALVTVLTVAAVALASGSRPRVQVDDPNDTKGTMDIRSVLFDPEAGPPRWNVLTFADWRPKDIQDRGFVFLYLDAAGDERAEHYVMIRSQGRELSGSLWLDRRNAPDRRLRALEVTRDSRSSVAVQVPVGSILGGSRTSYRWWVVTTFTGRVCPATCVDRLPDTGAVEEPPSSPTTTPTGSPTPTTTPSIVG